MEVFLYATPEEPAPVSRPEQLDSPLAIWVQLAGLPALPLWPKELKILGQRLLRGHAPIGCISVLGRLESPLATPEHDPFA